MLKHNPDTAPYSFYDTHLAAWVSLEPGANLASLLFRV